MNAPVVGCHAVRHCAAVAQAGGYARARVQLISTLRLLQRGMKSKAQQSGYINFVRQGEKLDGFMREGQREAKLAAGMQRDDSAAKNIVQMKSVPLSAFI